MAPSGLPKVSSDSVTEDSVAAETHPHKFIHDILITMDQEDHVNIRILHSSSKAHYKGDTKNHGL